MSEVLICAEWHLQRLLVEKCLEQTPRETEGVRMLENIVELLGGLCLIALPLLISFCIVGSIVAALQAVSRARAL
jgi:hypothetical protein